MTEEADPRETQKMRGRPVTNTEALESAQRLINRAHNAGEPKSRMSIPVRADDDDVQLTDYLLEANALEQRVVKLRAALEAAVSKFQRSPRHGHWVQHGAFRDEELDEWRALYRNPAPEGEM